MNQDDSLEEKKKKLLEYWKKAGIIIDEKVLQAFQQIKRENFVLEQYSQDSYLDNPLPIGFEQTISQPTTVMYMTQALELREDDIILEVGTGSGYQAAILGDIVKKGKVYSTEIIPLLAETARRNLIKQGIKNVDVICWDGSKGYDAAAPYDRIIVTATMPNILKSLVTQLKNEGILVGPVGHPYSFLGQDMIKFTKKEEHCIVEHLGSFAFVPLRGEYGFQK